MATAQMSTKGSMENRALVQPYNGMPRSNAKERTAATGCGVFGTQRHCTELKKLHSREYVLCGSTCIKFLEWEKLIYGGGKTKTVGVLFGSGCRGP